jgi:hypothetical protein
MRRAKAQIPELRLQIQFACLFSAYVSARTEVGVCRYTLHQHNWSTRRTEIVSSMVAQCDVMIAWSVESFRHSLQRDADATAR